MFVKITLICISMATLIASMLNGVNAGPCSGYYRFFMPRYYFHTANGGVHRDDTGTELPGLLAARVHAIKYAGEVMADEPEVLWDGQEFYVEVRNEAHQLLFIVTCKARNAPAAGETK